MVSKLWWNLLLWGLGDRLEKKNDYKTDLLLVLNLMAWYSLLSLTAQTGNFLLVWLLAAAVNTPQIWIVTQLVVGYIMARKARSPSPTKKAFSSKEAVSSPAGASDSEEP